MYFPNLLRSWCSCISTSALLTVGVASTTLAQVSQPTVEVTQSVRSIEPVSKRATDLLMESVPPMKLMVADVPIGEILTQNSTEDAPESKEPVEIQLTEQGVRVPPALVEGVEIDYVYLYFRHPNDELSQDGTFRQQIIDTLGVQAGAPFSSLLIEQGLNQIRQLSFVKTAEYRLYESNTPGKVIVAVLVTTQPTTPETPPVVQGPRGIFVTGDFSEFPTLYSSDRAYAKITVNSGIGLFSDTNSWFGSTPDFVRGSYQPRGTITWPEAYIELGLAGITQVGDSSLYAYGAISFTESSTLAPDIFRSDTRFYGDIEELYGGILIAEKGSPISFNLSTGRQDFQLNRNWLFGKVLGSANALERGSSFLNARTTYDNTVLADLRVGEFRIQGFYLDPDEFPVAETETRFLGINLKYNNNRDLEAALAYITIPQSNTTYIFPDGQRFKREGLQVINPRVRWSSPFGVEGLSLEAEYAYEWNNNFAMSAQAGYIWTTYTFKDVPWRPSISYRFAGFSGDNPNTASYERFDSLRGGGLGDWLQGIGLAKVYNNSNLLSHRVEFKVNPTNTLQFSLDYFYLFADQLNNLGGNAALSSLQTRDIGQEVMLTTRWSVTQNLFLLGVTSIAFPSDAIRRSVTEDSSPWFTVQVSLFLGF